MLNQPKNLLVQITIQNTKGLDEEIFESIRFDIQAFTTSIDPKFHMRPMDKRFTNTIQVVFETTDLNQERIHNYLYIERDYAQECSLNLKMDSIDPVTNPNTRIALM